MRQKGLDALIKNVRALFMEFRDVDMKSISDKRVADALAAHKLTIEELVTVYTERPTTTGA